MIYDMFYAQINIQEFTHGGISNRGLIVKS